MDKILFSERLVEKRKKKGYKTQKEFAEAYDSKFPTKRKDESAGNVEIGGILGTIKHYENPNYTKSMPTLDKVDNICSLLECDIDYLTGRIDQETHEKEDICEYTGLSEKAVDMLHHLKQHGNAEEQQTISFINRVLSDPGKAPGRGLLELTLFSWLEQYVTLASVNLYDLNPEDRKRVNNPAFELTSGIPLRINAADLFQQQLLNMIRDTLEAYREEEEKK